MNALPLFLPSFGKTNNEIDQDYPQTAPVIRNEWTSLNKPEMGDGLYQPLCAAARLVLDHFSVGVVSSFSVVGVMHAILWRNIISGKPRSL